MSVIPFPSIGLKERVFITYFFGLADIQYSCVVALAQTGDQQHWPLLRPLRCRFADETALGVLLPASDDPKQSRMLASAPKSASGESWFWVAATRKASLMAASILSCNWLIRACRRSFSFTRASPVSTRVIPRLRWAKLSSKARMCSTCWNLARHRRKSG